MCIVHARAHICFVRCCAGDRRQKALLREQLVIGGFKFRWVLDFPFCQALCDGHRNRIEDSGIKAPNLRNAFSPNTPNTELIMLENLSVHSFKNFSGGLRCLETNLFRNSLTGFSYRSPSM